MYHMFFKKSGTQSGTQSGTSCRSTCPTIGPWASPDGYEYSVVVSDAMVLTIVQGLHDIAELVGVLVGVKGVDGAVSQEWPPSGLQEWRGLPLLL
jgi:hypothetical protein